MSPSQPAAPSAPLHYLPDGAENPEFILNREPFMDLPGCTLQVLARQQRPWEWPDPAAKR